MTTEQLHFILYPSPYKRLVADFVAAVDGSSADSAWVKHYNFVDFPRFGSAWTPTYFNVVRDPVERVHITVVNNIVVKLINSFCKFQIVSWFYYWRAAWNVVERKLAFPEQPLPDPKMLRMDFDTCVRTGQQSRFGVVKFKTKPMSSRLFELAFSMERDQATCSTILH